MERRSCQEWTLDCVEIPVAGGPSVKNTGRPGTPAFHAWLAGRLAAAAAGELAGELDLAS